MEPSDGNGVLVTATVFLSSSALASKCIHSVDSSAARPADDGEIVKRTMAWSSRMRKLLEQALDLKQDRQQSSQARPSRLPSASVRRPLHGTVLHSALAHQSAALRR